MSDMEPDMEPDMGSAALAASPTVAPVEPGPVEAGWRQKGGWHTPASPTVAQREQALAEAFDGGAYAAQDTDLGRKTSIRRMAEARRLLGLAPKGEGR